MWDIYAILVDSYFEDKRNIFLVTGVVYKSLRKDIIFRFIFNPYGNYQVRDHNWLYLANGNFQQERPDFPALNF